MATLLTRAEMAACRANDLHDAAQASARYARALTKIACDAVTCAERQAQALLPPFPEPRFTALWEIYYPGVR